MGLFKIEPEYFSSVKWGSYSIAISFIRQIALVSVFIAAVGADDYAFWLILLASALMIRALNLGQLHYTSNLINLNYHVKNDINTELLLGQGANIICMSLQLMLAFIVSFPSLLSYFTNFSIDYIVAVNAQPSFVFLVLSRILLQYVSLFLLRLLEPIGKINLSIKYQAIGDALDFGVTFLAIYFTNSLFYTCLSLFVFALIYAIYMYFYVKKNVPFVIPFFKGIEYLKSLQLIRRSGTLTFSFIVEKIYETGLNLVIVRAYAASAIPQFATNRVMSNSFYRVSNILVSPILPSVQKEFTLKNENYILDKMSMFWNFSNTMLLICITAGMPFFLHLYTLWTGDKIDFNLNLICFLFMAIAFQNYSMIFIEFFKKTNLSRQMLLTNVIKVLVTILAILMFGQLGSVSGLGTALLFGEIASLGYVSIVIISLFKSHNCIKVFLQGLLPVLLLSIALVLYMYTLNYLLLLICNCAGLLYIYYTFRFKLLNK